MTGENAIPGRQHPVLRRATAVTLGCRLNQADTALLFDRLQSAGCEIVRPDTKEKLDVIVVNTCTVTGTAGRKSRQAVHRLRRLHPESCIVVTGCSITVDKAIWEEDQTADILLPNTEKNSIAARLTEYWRDRNRQNVSEIASAPPEIFRENAAGFFPFKSRAMLKIQEGCDSFCSYCIVPYARGRERSRDWKECLEEFQKLLDAGYREIVITGVNVCAYRCGSLRLGGLLEKLLGRNGDYRIRLSSTEPHPDNRSLLDIMAGNSRICRFLHLSLQYGTDAILRKMNRKYSVADYAAFVTEARARIPGIHIGTDIIVGFPGETDAIFEQCCDFVGQMAFANTHIFNFSPREGTPAAGFPDQVPAAVAAERHRQLEKICATTSREYLRSQIGEVLPVLFESENRAGEWSGWSDNYVKVCCPEPSLSKQEIVRIAIDRLRADGTLAGYPA